MTFLAQPQRNAQAGTWRSTFPGNLPIDTAQLDHHLSKRRGNQETKTLEAPPTWKQNNQKPFSGFPPLGFLCLPPPDH